MKLPSVQYADRITKYKQIRFNGLNHSLGAGDGELWDMENMTGDYWPLLASRAPRFLYKQFEDPGGIFAWEKLCWVAGGKFYYDGEEKGAVSAGQKTFTAMGSYILIFPDKCYYNAQTDTFGSLEAKWTGESLTFCDGVLYEEAAEANCIQAEGVSWEDYFQVGDAIFITGCETNTGNNKTDIIRAIDGDKLYFYEYAFTVGTEKGALCIERTVPELRYVCELDNRLWGCTEDTIYCSKLADPFNWNVYDGLDSDAWAITPTSTGRFTGSFAYGGYPIAFKEEQIYKIYGSVPSSYSPVGSATLGLAEGSGASPAVAGETLFYLCRNGVMAYTGGIPQPIGSAFGRKRFKNGTGGSDGLKYYISMCDETDTWGLYVYDTQTGNWYREDRMQVTHFARLGSLLYMLSVDGTLWITGPEADMPEDAQREQSVNWMVEFSDFTEEDPNKKHTGKLQLRLELDEGASAQVWMQFDSDGIWHRVKGSLGQSSKRSYYLPIIPRRCDHYRIKITGTGGCRIYSLVREVGPGSEHKTKQGRN